QALDLPRDLLQESTGLAEMGWCGRLVQQGQVRAGEMQNLASYAKDMSESIRAVPEKIQVMFDRLRPLAKAWELLESEPSIGLGSGRLPRDVEGRPARAEGHLEFRGVEFAYPGGGGPVLRGTSFEVLPGTTVGVTGASGGGKSTLFRLLERFYDPSAGSCRGSSLPSLSARSCSACPSGTTSPSAARPTPRWRPSRRRAAPR
ncbi:unnamed protein product, partial [Prorocentrum cordatum]